MTPDVCANDRRPGRRLTRWLASASLVLSACGHSTPTTPATPAPPTNGATAVASVVVSGSVNFTAAGQTSQLTATATLSDGTSQTVTTTATWKTANANVATVSPAGLVTAAGIGAAEIDASYQGKIGSVQAALTATQGPIGVCGSFSGAGPFTVAGDIASAAIGCLTFSNSTSGQLDCQGHNVSSVTLSGVQGFTLRNCVIGAGLNQTLRVLNSSHVTVDASQVSGSLYVNGTHDSTFMRSTFRWPLLPAAPSGFESSEVYFIGGANNTIRDSTVDGGWDGNPATYQRQGCDDGVLFNSDANLTVAGNAIMNVFDAGIEPGAAGSPITATITGNTITHAGYTGIGGYYVMGWQNSVFSGNTVVNSPSLLKFVATDAKSIGVTSMTLVNNQFTNNRLVSPTDLPGLYGGGVTQAMLIDYVNGGLPNTVSNNLVAGNDFGTVAFAPWLRPTSGFIDGGGNTCQPGGSLSCGVPLLIAVPGR